VPEISAIPTTFSPGPLHAFVINLVISVVLTLVFRAARLPAGTDETMAADYSADPGEAPVTSHAPERRYRLDSMRERCRV
jgi:hypothetical protein